jgi:hypothetical protein
LTCGFWQKHGNEDETYFLYGSESQAGVSFILNSLALDASWMVALNVAAGLTFALTIAPTLFEMGGPLFARAGIVLAQTAVYALCLFDALTDAPVSNAFLAGYADKFAALPPMIDTLVYSIVFLGWLFLASYGFELLFVIFAIVTLRLLISARKPMVIGQ